MRGTIRKLFVACVVLVLLSLGSWYAASRQEPGPQVKEANALAEQFAGEPGDGWRLAGVGLLLVAVAVAGAGGMLWWREREAEGAGH